MSSLFRLPLAASIAAHGCAVALLIVLAARLPPMPPVPVATGGIEITLVPPEPPPPVAETPPPPPEPLPPPEAQPPPLEAQLPPEPPPPVVEAEAPPPPPLKPALKPLLPPRRPPPQPVRTQAPQQTAMVPPQAVPLAPTPTGPVVSAGYRAALSAWLESHKHYPESARERSEEGRAVLQFRVTRSGRVLTYALLQSTGHPDLDAALDQMMRGASMPPFPADMAVPEVEVSVAIRFALAR